MPELSLPHIGCGTWTYDDETARENVLTAIETGYRLIDTAAYYKNERGVGSAIAASGIPREELYVNSKVWKTDLGYRKTKKAFYRSLERLNLDYLDCYLIHWPATESQTGKWKELNAGTWRALEELKAEGLIRHIGVSNFTPKYIEALKETATEKPEINQIEFHPGFSQPETVEYCRREGILVEAWSPFGRGDVFQNRTLLQIAQRHGASLASVCLAWIGSHGVLPIVKSSNKDRLAENLKYRELVLTREEIEVIDGISFFGKLGYDPETIRFDRKAKLMKYLKGVLKK